MMKTISKKKMCLIGVPVLAVFVLSGVLLCKSKSSAGSNGLTPERIYEIHKEYVESTYGPGTGFTIDSYGESGIGHISHETGEGTWGVTDNGR